MSPGISFPTWARISHVNKLPRRAKSLSMWTLQVYLPIARITSDTSKGIDRRICLCVLANVTCNLYICFSSKSLGLIHFVFRNTVLVPIFFMPLLRKLIWRGPWLYPRPSCVLPRTFTLDILKSVYCKCVNVKFAAPDLVLWSFSWLVYACWVRPLSV